MRSRHGYSLVETLVALVILAMAIGMVVPSLAALRSKGRAAAGARQIAVLFQQLRWQAVTRSRSHGVLFERDAEGWFWRIARDGNGNGMRTAEVVSGVDPTVSGPHRLADSIEHVHLGFPWAGPFPRIPPASGSITDTTDPVRFGRSDLVSFSRLGQASSGTVYVTDGTELFGIVMFGPTARIRVWRFDTRGNRWVS